MKRVLLVLLLLLLPLAALGEALPEPFMGYFEDTVYIRPTPAPGDTLGHIPANTPVMLAPVDDRYAQVTYNGRTGYVYYVAVKSMPEETPLTPYTAYLPNAKYLFAAPMDRAESLLTIPAETPVTVTASVGRFLHIIAEGQEGYVYARDTASLDNLKESASTVEFYVEAATQARAYPLRNAAPTLTLDLGRVYVSEAMCNGFYRLTAGGVTGYVYAGKVTKVRSSGQTVRAAMITPDTPLYAAADPAAALESRWTDTQLMLLEPQQGGFHKMQGQRLYVHANDVVSYVVEVTSDQRLQILQDAPLHLLPQENSAVTTTLGRDQLYLAEYAVEGWYLLQAKGQWGFLKKDAATAAVLRVDADMMRTAAVLTADAVFYADDGKQAVLPTGTGLFLTQSAGQFYCCSYGEDEGLIAKANVQILGSDTELTAYTIATGTDIAAMDFPDAALGGDAFTIPAGKSMKITGFNRCYLMVDYNGQTGYAPQTGLLTAESEGIPATEDVPAYTLVLDKSTLMAYAFTLNEDGSRGELVICAKVGIGKATTPTPSGTFTLGTKERWHRFPRTYTPHTTEYVRARFIHGWPCSGKSESKVANYLVTTGRVTGGCLRSPFEFARWVYMNCPSYITELTVVNGGFEAPESAESLRVY